MDELTPSHQTYTYPQQRPVYMYVYRILCFIVSRGAGFAVAAKRPPHIFYRQSPFLLPAPLFAIFSPARILVAEQ